MLAMLLAKLECKANELTNCEIAEGGDPDDEID
jgi:hypothetical protein